MNNIARFNVKKYVLSCLSVFCVLFLSTAAQAQIEGCRAEVLAAHQAKGQAKVAYDVAVTEQIYVKPDSVLALTCVNRSAGVSAERGGNLFSGSFISNPSFMSLISDMLTAFFGQFMDAEGFENPGTSVLYAAGSTNLQDNEECTGIEDTWARFKEKGVAGGVPMVTFQNLIDGFLPSGAGTRFIENWNTANADDIFSNLSTAIGNLPVPNIPSFAGANRVCDVMNTLGYAIPCP